MANKRPARVLIVDDDDAIRWVLHETLEQAGYTVSEAPDGKPALDQLRASQHELIVLLDVLMPGMDGLTLLERIAGEASNARRHAYILITARRQTFPMPVVNLFKQLGVRVMQKPFELDALVAAVEQAASRTGAASLQLQELCAARVRLGVGGAQGHGGAVGMAEGRLPQRERRARKPQRGEYFRCQFFSITAMDKYPGGRQKS